MKRLRWVGWYAIAAFIVFVVMPGLSYLVVLGVERALSIERFGTLGVNSLLALPILLFGLAWMGWSSVRLRRFGRGHAIHAFGKAPAPTQRLCMHGPYRHCQNPMYFGWLTVMVGVGVALGSIVFILLVPALWVAFIYWYLPRFEWPDLEARFGEEWRVWNRSTPLIVPRPWRRTKAGGGALQRS